MAAAAAGWIREVGFFFEGGGASEAAREGAAREGWETQIILGLVPEICEVQINLELASKNIFITMN